MVGSRAYSRFTVRCKPLYLSGKQIINILKFHQIITNSSPMKRILLIATLIPLLLAGFLCEADTPAGLIPVTGEEPGYISPALNNRSTLPNFIARIATSGNPDQIAGLFLTGKLELPVLQQPANNPGYVSSDPDSVTQFRLASQYGSLAFLAHNNLAGQRFFSLKKGQILSLVYGNGEVNYFRIVSIRQYQALSPNSPYSSFVDLDDPDGKVLSVNDLFYNIYAQSGRLILQTCIEAGGQPSWGRLFIIAVPVAPFPQPALMM